MSRALDAAETIADLLLVNGLEAVVGRVDVGRQNGEPAGFRLVVEVANLVGVIHDERQVGGDERGRMVRLEVRGLVGDQRVCRSVRLVEPIAGKLFHQVEELRRARFRQAVFLCPVDEHEAMLGHLLGKLLAHRAPQKVRGAERVAADYLCDLHYLFLIHHYAVGGREDRLETLIVEVDALRALLAADVVGDQLHRAGTEQRDQRNDVIEPLGRRLQQELAHAARFELEHADRAAFLEHLV